MASEKILAMIEEVKALTVLELNELVKALEASLTLFSLTLAQAKWALSKLLKRSPVLA